MLSKEKEIKKMLEMVKEMQGKVDADTIIKFQASQLRLIEEACRQRGVKGEKVL